MSGRGDKRQKITKNNKKRDRQRQSGAEREERTRLGCCAKLHLTL